MAAASGAWSATSSSRKPSASTTPITIGVLRRQRGLEVVVLGGGAAHERAGRQRGAQPVDRSRRSPASDGSVVGDRLDQRRARSPPALGRRDAARSPRRRAAGRGRLGELRRRDDLERARGARRRRRPGPARSRRASCRRTGTTVIDGMPVRRPTTGAASGQEHDERRQAVGDRALPEPLAPAREARRAVLARVDPRQREPVDARAELRQHGRQQRQRRREDEDDREHDPERHRPEGRARHEHHGRERDQHRDAGEEHGLAGRVHRLRDRVEHGRRRPKKAPRKRTTMKSA